ncbi:unnamed protein product, partial [Prorocentrum cordatum]
MCAAPKTPKISEHLNISPDVLAEALCIQALQKKLSLNSAKLSGRLGTSPALLATGDLTRERLTDRKHGLENIPATLGGEVFAMGADDDED